MVGGAPERPAPSYLLMTTFVTTVPKAGEVHIIEAQTHAMPSGVLSQASQPVVVPSNLNHCQPVHSVAPSVQLSSTVSRWVDSSTVALLILSSENPKSLSFKSSLQAFTVANSLEIRVGLANADADIPSNNANPSKAFTFMFILCLVEVRIRLFIGIWQMTSTHSNHETQGASSAVFQPRPERL